MFTLLHYCALLAVVRGRRVFGVGREVSSLTGKREIEDMNDKRRTAIKQAIAVLWKINEKLIVVSRAIQEDGGGVKARAVVRRALIRRQGTRDLALKADRKASTLLQLHKVFASFPHL